PMVVALGAGLVIGSVAGTTRQDLADQYDVDVIAGRPAFEHWDIGPDVVRARVPLHNGGPRTVEIVDVEAVGWLPTTDADVLVTAVEPGQWATLSLRLTPNCDTPSGKVMSALVRTAIGEESVALTLAPGFDGLPLAWARECDPVLNTHLVTWATEILSSGADAVRMRVMVDHADPIDAAPMHVLRVRSGIAGFDVHVRNVRADAASSTSKPPLDLVLTWTITDCDVAPRLAKAHLGLDVATIDGDHREFYLPVPLGSTALVELARFSALVCG
ncbi:MAG: hypothetical protein ACRD08_16810, partial [Acidimicrobiales bacterium]